MNARDYYLRLQNAIHSAPHVIRSDVRFEEIDANECYVSGVLMLMGGYELHVAEYIVTEPSLTRPKYRYQMNIPNVLEAALQFILPSQSD